MIVYLIPAGATLYSRKGRVQGWRHINLDHEGKRKVKEMARGLKERNVQKVFCSDLLAESGFAVGRELQIPTLAERNLRHFNVGRHAGKQRDEVENIIESIIPRWEKDITIPISGGDSWASYMKRMKRAFGSLFRSKLESVVLVLDIRTMQTFKQMVGPQTDPKDSLLEKCGTINPEKVLMVKLTLPAAA